MLAISECTTYIRFKVFLHWKWYTTSIFKCRKYFNLTLIFICLGSVNSHSSTLLIQNMLNWREIRRYLGASLKCPRCFDFLVREFEFHVLLCCSPGLFNKDCWCVLAPIFHFHLCKTTHLYLFLFTVNLSRYVFVQFISP